MTCADPLAIRGGRFLPGPGGLRDLATGLSVRLVTSPWPAPSSAAATDPRGADDTETSDGGVLDAWTTRDWLGRWRRHRAVTAVPLTRGIGDEVPALSWDDPTALGITRAGDAGAWRGLAVAARRAGVVPVRVDLLAWLDCRSARRWPPLLIGVATNETRVPATVMAWLAHGGRVVALAALPPACLTTPHDVVPRNDAAPVRAPRLTSPGAGQRLIRRAWRARAQAAPAPSITWLASTTASPRARVSRRVPQGGTPGMTHLELLDVTAALEEVRRDEDALVATCRAVRQHAGAHRAGILVVRNGVARVLATVDPSPEALQAWQRLCLHEEVGGLASAAGWHAASRHGSRDDLAVHVCGTWRTPAEAHGRSDLLAVFARLASTRIPPLATVPAASSPLAESLVGDSVVMHDVRAQITLAARAPFPVLIRGESGCGKELAARAIHALGPRRLRRCAAINCAALPDDLIESELFGHVRGAFTGASADRPGLFDEADGGTLFLDEVGELGARAQAKLLRVLQDGEVRRVGENGSRRVDVRVIAATNVSLEDAVRRGTFRADLFYRLDVVRVRMPALRERREDIPLLARHFWRDCTARVGSRARLDDPVLEALALHDWPGNVRQLQNTLAALAVRVPSRGVVDVGDLPPELRCPDGTAPYERSSGLDAARRQFEATFVRDALSRAGGRPSQAARDLGLTRQGLTKLVRRLGLHDREGGARLP